MNASRVESGLPADPAIPGFTAALDPCAFGRGFAEAIEPAGLDLTSCTLDRFRYRRGERLVVVYRVAVTDRQSGGARSFIVAGRLHAERPLSSKHTKVSTDRDLSGIESLPALGMRIEIFPRDRRLPDLRKYVEEPCSPCITRLVHAATGWLPAHTEEIAVTPVRYRPGIAATLHYRTTRDGAGSAGRQCFVKVSPHDVPNSAPCAAAILNRVLECERQPIRLSVPSLSDAKSGVAAYAAAPGRSLQKIALSSIDFKPLVEAAGSAMARLHIARVPELPRVSGVREQDKYEKAGRFLAWACPEAEPALHRIAEVIPAFWSSGVQGPTHGDMKPDHLFVSPENEAVNLIDNDAVAISNPLVDIGSMLARLDAMHWLESADEQRMRPIAEAFSDAYFAVVPSSWSRHLGQARALATLLVCQHAVQRLLPGWRTRVPVELEKAAALS